MFVDDPEVGEMIEMAGADASIVIDPVGRFRDGQFTAFHDAETDVSLRFGHLEERSASRPRATAG